MTHNYHMMPDGTPIPPEGLKCWVWDSPSDDKAQRTVVAVTHHGFCVDSPDAPWRCAEPVKEPTYVPLTMDDYHGEPIRFNNSRCGVALDWDSQGVRFGSRHRALWEDLAETAEYYKDGEWQPMRKVKA